MRIRRMPIVAPRRLAPMRCLRRLLLGKIRRRRIATVTVIMGGLLMGCRFMAVWWGSQSVGPNGKLVSALVLVATMSSAVAILKFGGGAGGIQDIYRRGLRVNQYYGTSIFLISSKAFLEFSMRGLLGSVAPCMLYGTNAERLRSTPGTFANHCMSYSGLYLIGTSFFGWNCLAPWFTYPTRTALRRMFNLEGNCEALHRTCGCCGLCVEDEVQREHCESVCDFATHVFCHTCALCQEGRELRRRMPHPGFNARPVLVMIPPTEQSMRRGV